MAAAREMAAAEEMAAAREMADVELLTHMAVANTWQLQTHGSCKHMAAARAAVFEQLLDIPDYR